MSKSLLKKLKLKQIFILLVLKKKTHVIKRSKNEWALINSFKWIAHELMLVIIYTNNVNFVVKKNNENERNRL